MTEKKAMKAVWTPSWYELDQSIAVGAQDKFWFFQDNPSLELTGDSVEQVDLVFFNQLDSACNSEVRFAHVEEIHHEVLGALQRVDTDGLDYVFKLANGDEVMVNAEEEPGQTYDDDLQIENWSVIVMLKEVSEPISEAV